jgi:hypothetical protein
MVSLAMGWILVKGRLTALQLPWWFIVQFPPHPSPLKLDTCLRIAIMGYDDDVETRKFTDECF